MYRALRVGQVPGVFDHCVVGAFGSAPKGGDCALGGGARGVVLNQSRHFTLSDMTDVGRAKENVLP
jgi:hypothetical protein